MFFLKKLFFKLNLNGKINQKKEQLKYDDYFQKRGHLGSDIGLRFAVPKIHDFFNQDSETVLDVGCGGAHAIMALQKLGWTAKGTDISKWLINNPLRELKEKGIVFCAPASNLPFPDNSFDVAMSTEVMEHLPEKEVEDAIKEMARVAKKHLFLTINFCPSSSKNPLEYHLTIKPRVWWEKRFEKFNLRKRSDILNQIQNKDLHETGGRKIAVEYFVYDKV